MMALGAASASATVVSSPGAPTGLPAGTSIGGVLSGTAKLNRASNPAQFATCSTGSLGGVVGASGGASVAVTSPTLSLGPAAGATTCVNTGLPFLVRSASLTSFSSAAVTAGGSSSGTLTLSGVSVTAQVTSGGLPGTCVFSAPSVTGVLNNADNSVTFTNVNVTSASGACSAVSPFQFSAKFAPLKVSSGAFAGQLVSVS
jgi:hypothetical protein